MPRPLQGKQRKVDVGLTLDPEIYKRAKAYAATHRMSLSQLVDILLENLVPEAKELSRSEHMAAIRLSPEGQRELKRIAGEKLKKKK